jgi:hypothetical protein
MDSSTALCCAGHDDGAAEQCTASIDSMDHESYVPSCSTRIGEYVGTNVWNCWLINS